MNKKHRKIYDAIFTEPINPNIDWDDVITLIKAVGGTATKEDDSSIRFDLRNLSLNVHSSHPQKQLKRYQIKAIREFLFKARINP